MPALQHIVSLYIDQIHILEQRMLSLTISNEEENLIKVTQKKFKSHLERLNNIIDEVSKNSEEHFEAAGTFLDKYNYFHEALVFCQGHQQIQNTYIKLESQKMIPSGEFYYQTQNQNK